MLDQEFDNVANNAGLWMEQSRLHELEQAVQVAIHNKNENEFIVSWGRYRLATIQQLLKVEHVMMSKLHRLCKQHDDDLESLKQIMIKEVMALIVQNNGNDKKDDTDKDDDDEDDYENDDNNNNNESPTTTTTDIDNLQHDMEHFVKYANHVLERHTYAIPWVRLWDHSLWAISTESQWEQYNTWIQETISESLYRDVQDIIRASQ